MARPPNRDKRRQEITAGLIKAMASRGYGGASIGEIAKAASLSPGLIHYHFKSKQQILLAAIDNLVTAHRERLDRSLEEAGSPAEKVEAFIDTHVGLGANADPDALACWVLLSGEALRQPEVRAPYGAAIHGLIETLREIIGGGIAAGAFECAQPAEAASALVAGIQGYLALAAVDRELIPRGSAARSLGLMASGLLQESGRLGKSGLLEESGRLGKSAPG